MKYDGYIYIWYDTKAKLFYIGGHYGKVEDRYISSSKPMLRAYKIRPETFKFKVLEYIVGSTTELRNKEQKWLDKIQDHELLLSENIKNKTVKYYNVKKNSVGGNGKGTNKGKSSIGGWNRGVTGSFRSDEVKIKISIKQKETWQKRKAASSVAR